MWAAVDTAVHQRAAVSPYSPPKNTNPDKYICGCHERDKRHKVVLNNHRVILCECEQVTSGALSSAHTVHVKPYSFAKSYAITHWV